MNAVTTAAVFRELDVCRCFFDSLSNQLKNNAGIADYHPLAVLTAEGRRKIDGIVDQIDQARMEQ
ncbi:MAG: hypothetical protein P4L44_16545 [Oryzomonas sp.]|uniref:hypothetical protein n=1 Tax=Oryzomonas sp. TaxID=2855186 RepID=UPI00284CBD04|nr:hypothetical protein [Oryzomonas sp.]MDR3581572.1 hypothetical protein [Oryzomonas sp.]